MAPVHINISDDPPPFNPSMYLRKNKKFPASSDVLPEAHAALADILKLPASQAALFPDRDMPITDFLALPLPRESAAFVLTTPAIWFSDDEPTADIDTVKTRSIPSQTFLKILTAHVGQAWFDGAKSIVDPRFNDGHDRLPLCVLTFWKEMAGVSQDQIMWGKSHDWLKTELGKKTTPDVDRNALMAALALFELAMAFGHIDMMMADLAARAAADKDLAGTVIIAPLHFSRAIQDGAKKKSYKKKDTPLLSRYAEHIKNTEPAKLHFPLHIDGNHWIAGAIDFKKKLIGTGDGRVGMSTPPHKFIKDLKRWLNAEFGANEFTYQGDSLEHGDQKDGSSCSIITGNIVAVDVFGDEVWTQDHAAGARANCFMRLIGSPAIRKMESPVPKQSKITEETPAEISIAVALGDHNFPDLEDFAVGDDLLPAPRSSRPTLAELLNPLPDAVVDAEPPVSKPEAMGEDCEMPLVQVENPHGYTGDHGDLDSEGGDSDVGGDGDSMDVDEEGVPPAPEPTKPKTLFAFFGAKAKTAPANAKRSRDSDLDLDESIDIDALKPPKKAKKASGTGTSKSAVAAQALRDAYNSGELTVETADPAKYARWKKKLLADDPKVVFHPTDVKRARHSKCGAYVLMGEAYQTGKWTFHLDKDCRVLHPESKKRKGPGKGLTDVPTLTNLWKGKKPSAKGRGARETRPCPGITVADCPRLPMYLKRTGAFGGGGRSVTAIAREKFGKLFRFLKGANQKIVTDQQLHERKWTNDHSNMRVFSTTCNKNVSAPQNGSRTLPCSGCSSILGNPRFKQAIRRPIPDDENYIYVNEKYRNQLLGGLYARSIGLKEIIETADAKNTPCIKYAQGTLKGKYTDFKVFEGLVEAMVMKVDRLERGVGMQNFKYAPAWDEMAHIINIHSPRAARALEKHFSMRTQRSFRAKEAREPRFPMGICDRTFELVEEYVTALKYDGPVGLSVDDTKLFSGLRMYYDAKEKADFLVGAVDGPIRVADPEAMKKILADPTIVRGTKVRVWCLTIPLPGVTPLVVAAMPIANDNSADDLLPHTEKVLYGRLQRKIRVVSYANDGTETERSVQRKLVEKGENIIRYTITSPIAGAPDLELEIATFFVYPVVMIQDSKHALKTFRNNLFTGARMLTFGNYTAIFRRIYELAMAPDSPMFRRDVERLDRQDDAAATRLFCAAVLEYLSENHPEYIGEIVYLFVFGELVDSYQSRKISHTERIKLALRARYFLDAWANYLDAVGYKHSHYFLSREAVDIARYLIDGIISLIFVHRDHVPGGIPLIPWYHSSEPCEHTFGNSRDIVKDFTFLDFIFMIPKLRVTMREAVLSGKSSHANATAAGYTHTYFESLGSDLAALAIYPSDQEIQLAAQEAAAESDSLVAVLGIAPAQLHQKLQARAHQHPVLPSIGSWLKNDDDESEEEDEEEFDNEDVNAPSEADQLQAIIDMYEHPDAPLLGVKEDRKVMSLTCASIAITADEQMRINKFSELDDEVSDEILGDEHVTIQETLAAFTTPVLPSLKLGDEISKPFGVGPATSVTDLDFKSLIAQRRLHQTRQADRCCRTSKSRSDGQTESVESTRRQILREFHEILKEHDQTRGVGTTVERQVRWTSNSKPAAGNSANAAAAAANVASKAATRHKKLFKDANVPRFELVATARLTHFHKLSISDFGIVWTQAGLRIAQVVVMYSKGGGKYGKHGAVSEHHNISAISNLGVQLFEFVHARQFRAIPEATSRFQTKHYDLLAPFNFLYRLHRSVKTNASGVELAPEDKALFADLQNGIARFNAAVKASRSRKKAAELDGDAEEDTTQGF
ncbi:hypothetical protein DFH09DRAFT_1421922 [Mycena vulgaris]|nr:hypothetical protein DFH09DRAFT_1421922 [Mycena vulgaris]